MIDPNAPSKPIDVPKRFERVPGMDYVMFTNVPNAHEVFKDTIGCWDIHQVDPPRDKIPKRNFAIYANRYYKWHPQMFFPTHDVAIYVDGCQVPDADKRQLWWRCVLEVVNDDTAQIVMSKHHANTCVYKELQDIVLYKKDTHVRMSAVNLYLESSGLPRNYGLLWNGCYVFNMSNTLIQKAMHELWEDMIIHTYRDQSLFMFHLWKNEAGKCFKIAPLDKLITNVDNNTNHVYI